MMDSLLGGLCVLGFVLGLITLVGHGLWLVLAAFNRWFTGAPSSVAPQPFVARRHCPACHAPLAEDKLHCVACGWGSGVQTSSPVRSLESLIKQIDRLQKMGSLDALSFERLNDVLQTELERMRTQARQDEAAEREAAAAKREEIFSSDIFETETTTPPAAPATKLAAPHGTLAAVIAPTEPATVPAPPPQKRTWSQLLDGFMEERNLRWGELIGGLLIVCGSIALVISFWSQIAERPFLKFFVFNGFTAAMFGAGAYTDKRLRLPTTSHGIGTIAALLVPLNFLALAAFSRDAADSVLTIAGEVVSIGLFAWLTWLTGRTIAPQSAPLFSVGVVGPSVAALLVRRFVHHDSGIPVLYALGLVPLSLYLVSVATSLWKARGTKELAESDVHAQFRFLGATTFASVLPLGLLVTRSGNLAGTLRWLAPLVSLLAAPGLATGLFLWKRVTDRAHTGIRTAGSAIAVAGVLILLAGIVLAWPHPAVMLLVSLVDFLILTAVALTQSMAAAHLLALPCLGLAYLIAVHVTRGELSWSIERPAKMAGTLLSAASGTALVPLAAVFGLATAWLSRSRREDSRFYGLVAGLAAVLSLALVTGFGLGRVGDPGGATWVYGIYAVALLAGAILLERRSTLPAEPYQPGSTPDPLEPIAKPLPGNRGSEAAWAAVTAWCGAGLWLVACIQGAVFHYGIPLGWRHSWLAAFLAHAGTLAVLALTVANDRAGAPAAGPIPTRRGRGAWSLGTSFDVRIFQIFGQTATASSCVAAACLVSEIPGELPGQIAGYALGLSFLWIGLAWALRSARLFTMFQTGVTGTVVFSVAAVIRTRAWATGLRDVWLDPWSWELQGMALALLGLGWVALQRVVVRPAPVGHCELEEENSSDATKQSQWRDKLRDLVFPPWPTFDRYVGWMLLASLVTNAIYGALPGVAQELTPRSLAAALESMRGVAVPATGRVVPALTHFEIAGIPHHHALDYGAWGWLVFVVLLFVAWRSTHPLLAVSRGLPSPAEERRPLRYTAGLLTALSTTCLLVAGLWETDVAAASALRWTSALFLIAVSATVWVRQGPESSSNRGWLTALVLIVSAAPVAAMGLFVGTAAVWRYTIDEALWTTLIVLLVLGGFALPIGVVLRIVSRHWLAQLPAETALATAAAAARRQKTADGMQQAGTLIWILGIGPLLAVGLYIVSAALRGNPIVGPEPGTLFQRMGLATSYATPLAICGLTLVGYAIRNRSPGFAFAAGLLFNVSATAAYLLLAAKGGLQLDAALWIRIAQLNAAVSAGFGLLWMGAAKYAAVRQHESEALAASEAGRPLLRIAGIPIPGLLVTQSLIGAALLAVWFIPIALGLFISQRSTPALVELAHPLGRSAWFLTLAGLALLCRLAGTRPSPGAVCAAVWSLAMMATSYACGWGDESFHAYHSLLVSHAAAGWILLGGFAAVARPFEEEGITRKGVARWTSFLIVLVMLLACRDVVGSDRPHTPVGVLASASVLAAALACYTRGRSFLYATGVLASLAESIWWVYAASPRPNLAIEWPTLLDVNVMAWLVPALASLAVERLVIVPSENREQNPWYAGQFLNGVGFHRFAGAAAVVFLAVVAGAGLISDAVGAGLHGDAQFDWPAMACAAAIVAACLWDPRSTAPTFGLYLLGLIAAGLILAQYDLSRRMIVWNGTLISAGYSFATALAWLKRQELASLARRCRIECTPEDVDRIDRWLVPATRLLCAIALVLVLVIDLRFAERGMRLATATAALVSTAALGLFARRGRNDSLFGEALFAAVVGVIGWSWAWLTPGDVDWMHRLVVMTAALAGMTAVYGLVPAKLLSAESDWVRAAARMLPRLCALALASVLLVMVHETLHFVAQGDAAMARSAIFVMALTILGLCAACLAAALIPGRDPLGLSERGRTAYVYAAEALLAVLFLHVRFTMPWMFQGFFIRYWPFIVMFVAFLGVGVSEIFRRQRRMVLAEPLERTGALLPVLPLLGFWAIPNEGHFSWVLLTAGAVYSALSILRRSFGFGLLAALAANGGLWYYLQHVQGFGFLEHPQLWMIPFAICVLGAAYLNHEQLSTEQMTTIRYLASIVIYISSTADIFLNGVSEAPWLPVVLAGLSVAGIMAGIVLRVRAFLFLGTGFLTLAMFTIIWHAAVDLHHTWLIWLTVVMAGVLVLGVFAVFEKKRQDILRVVDRIREWSP